MMPVADLILGWGEMEAALPAYVKAQEMWEGTADEVFASDSVKRELAKTGEEYKFSLIKTPVRVRASRCEISAVKVPGSEVATQKIGVVWKANDMAVYYPTLIRGTFIYGDYYLMAWQVDEEPDETSDDQLLEARVELTTRNPKNTRIIYDPENHRRKWFAIQRWAVADPTSVGESLWRVELFYADSVERWVSVKGQDAARPEGWEPFTGVEDDVLPVEGHDFGEVPFFHHRTDVPYGTSVMEDGYGAQNAVTKMLVTQITTTDSHGWPQRYGLVDKDAVLDEQNDTPQWDDDSDATAYQVDGLDGKGGVGGNIRSGPGTTQTLTGMKEVGQWAAADPAVFTDPAELYIRLMAQLTTTPLHYFDPSGDAPSGESLKTAEAPLVKEIEWLQLLQGGAVEEEWRFILGLLGIKVDDVEVRWAAVQSATGLSDWQMVQAKVDVGVPVDQALVETGYEPEQVKEWLDGQAEANTLAGRVALLAQIGTAIQSIGAGIALGVVDEAAAQAAVALVLNQVNSSGRGVDPA
jgi:hypothetical protein